MRALRCIAALLLMMSLLGIHAAPAPADEAPTRGPVDPRRKLPDDWAMRQSLDERYTPEFRALVNDAIKRGQTWLRKNQGEDGKWRSHYNRAGYPMGPSALATLTLSKCGEPRDSDAMKRAWAFLHKQALTRTYSVGVLLMALDARYAPARDPFAIEELDRYGRRKRGGDGDPCAALISKADRDLMKRGVSFLVKTQNADGVWRYPEHGFDLSCTQYALLGLKASERCGIPVPDKVWLAALKYLVAFQQKKGRPVIYEANEVRGRYRITWKEKALARGFTYVGANHGGGHGAQVTGSMTTAGLAGLVICNDALWDSRRYKGKLRTATRKGIRDAMAWMQTWMLVIGNPVQATPPLREPAAIPRWHYYYLYGLERAGILARVRHFGKTDWYEDGALLLLEQQNKNGGWGTLEDTCFALLFLKRATSRMNVPVITPRASEQASR